MPVLAELAPPIVQRMLQDPTQTITVDESLECLDECIRMGTGAANRAAGKHVLAVVGNTGAGKSTFIDYLHGCAMERREIIDADGKKAKVIQVAADSEPAELMAIGHSKQSATFVPGVEHGDKFVYIDCPGFLDNRGSEINIANAVNIKRTLHGAVR